MSYKSENGEYLETCKQRASGLFTASMPMNKKSTRFFEGEYSTREVFESYTTLISMEEIAAVFEHKYAGAVMTFCYKKPDSFFSEHGDMEMSLQLPHEYGPNYHQGFEFLREAEKILHDFVLDKYRYASFGDMPLEQKQVLIDFGVINTTNARDVGESGLDYLLEHDLGL